jgi:hypothetical protein
MGQTQSSKPVICKKFEHLIGQAWNAREFIRPLEQHKRLYFLSVIYIVWCALNPGFVNSCQSKIQYYRNQVLKIEIKKSLEL